MGTHREPFGFEGGPTQLADDAMRFLNGTPNVPALYSARSGYEIIQEIGVENIRAKSLRQTQLLIDLADESGIPVRTCREAGKRAGVVILDVPMQRSDPGVGPARNPCRLPAPGGHWGRASFLYH